MIPSVYGEAYKAIINFSELHEIYLPSKHVGVDQFSELVLLELALSEHHLRHFTLKNLELSYTLAAYWFISPQCVLCHFLSI